MTPFNAFLLGHLSGVLTAWWLVWCSDEEKWPFA